MEKLNLTALGVKELNDLEMTETDGGLAFIVAILIGIAAGVATGLVVNSQR